MVERKKELSAPMLPVRRNTADLYIPVGFDREQQKFVVDPIKNGPETEVRENSNQPENNDKEKDNDGQG